MQTILNQLYVLANCLKQEAQDRLILHLVNYDIDKAAVNVKLQVDNKFFGETEGKTRFLTLDFDARSIRIDVSEEGNFTEISVEKLLRLWDNSGELILCYVKSQGFYKEILLKYIF